MRNPKITAPNRAEFYGNPGSNYVYLKEINGDKVVKTYCMYGIGANKVRIVEISEDPKAGDRPVTEGPYVHCYGYLINLASEIQESNPLQIGERVILKHDPEAVCRGEILELEFNPSIRENVAKIKWDKSSKITMTGSDSTCVSNLRREP